MVTSHYLEVRPTLEYKRTLVRVMKLDKQLLSLSFLKVSEAWLSILTKKLSETWHEVPLGAAQSAARVIV